MNKLVKKYLAQKPKVLRGSLSHVAKEALKKRKAVLAVAKKYPTPFYIFDKPEAQKSIEEFKAIFQKYIPGLEIYYAVKSNPYSGLLKLCVQNSLGLDVSSARELKMALAAGAKKIIFSGPGKTKTELKMAIANRHKLILQIDSHSELKRLGQMLKNKRLTIRAGVRVYTKYHDLWTKFGINLEELPEFFKAAQKYPQIKLEGIQCHMSWNKNPESYQKMLQEIGKNLPPKIKFIDFGGGFETYRLEGYFPWTNGPGEVLKASADFFGQKIDFKDKYYLAESAKLASYAKAISQAIKKYIKPNVNCRFFCEPGRAISTKSMHLVLGVADVKTTNMAILDGGINMVGYELFEYFYYPTINLTRPAKREIACRLYGSLCTPYDLFAYYCYAKSIKEGDVIMIPNQGAYAYTLAQDFIKGIPPVYHLS